MGVNAAVVGILIAALYHPIWTSSILTPIDFAFAANIETLIHIQKPELKLFSNSLDSGFFYF
ncbi:hypothetical protein AMD00_02905 [Viridibacillus arvi]|uniref:Uncharacterized protein n=1 Tax=Viridibacillus arvi TaxID=263475 RepID=A0A0M0LKN7_9BACL|nr:hypothetical protein AMD00_02905 [Viridibacillus arvi]